MAGRTRRRNEEKEQFWRAVLRGHASSGLSVRQYCSKRPVEPVGWHGAGNGHG